MPIKKFDLIVIGAGSGGLGIALGMSKLGFRVLLIDKNKINFGGECLNTGCIPSKALIHVAKQIHLAKTSIQYGFEPGGKVDFVKVKNYIQQKQKRIRSHENVEFLKEQGIHIELGTASFLSKNELKVNEKIFKGRNIVIATGSAPRKINIRGAEAIPVLTNESIFNIEVVPEHFLFIGAGPVSIELGQAFSRLGSKVAFIIRGERILKKEDPEIAGILLNKLENEGIKFYFQSEIKEIREGRIAVVKSQSNKEMDLPTNALFMGLGRKLNFDTLAPEKAGIKMRDGKIVVNERLQTSNKNVFVCGDAADNLKFSHAAEMHNMLLINNFISPFKKNLNFDHFPWVTFTDPEIATFGLNENKLKEKNEKYEVLKSLGEADKAVTDDFEYGKLKLFIEKKKLYAGNAKILGGSLVAPNAGEITQELILANVAGLRLSNFMYKIYAYPTAGNINKIIARNRIIVEIKPWIQKLIIKWYRLKE